MRPRTHRLPVVALLLAAVAVACEWDRAPQCQFSTALAGKPDTVFELNDGSGVLRHLNVSPVSPCPQEDIIVRLWAINASQEPVIVDHFFPLQVSGDLGLNVPYGIGGLGHGYIDTVATGDSMWQGTSLKTVTSGPGTYNLGVIYDVNPDRWMYVPITVRAR